MEYLNSVYQFTNNLKNEADGSVLYSTLDTGVFFDFLK